MQTECRRAYSEYMCNIVCGDYSKGNNKKLWSYVKSLRQDNCGVSSLNNNGILYSNNKNKADILNQQFASVFTQENLSTLPNLGPSPHPHIPHIVISAAGVAKLLHGLNPSKASGPDEVPARLLKECADELAPALTHVFIASLQQREVPQDWRRAIVTPLFKKGDRSTPSNYRPVSLTSISCKVLEHIVHHHIITHLDSRGILNETQHGFRKNRSCETQLIITIDDLAKCLNENGQTDAILLDFSKAFDKVPHARLRIKLDYYGIRGQTLDWISSFLSDRSQNVVCGGSVSSSCNVASGVPQGTVLGPLLFLVYINDLPDQVKSTTRLFADDCLLYRRITSPEDVKILQNDLDVLQEWEKRWQMSFNPDKCEVLRITLKHKSIISDYKIHDHKLKTVKTAKYLGLNIDSKLNFNEHINNICKKANTTRAFVARITKLCPRKVKEDAYKTLVRPRLEYASAVWNPHTLNKINQIEAIQRRAVRSVANNFDRTSSVTEMLQKFEWESLEERRAKARVIMCFKIVNNMIQIPKHPYLVHNKLETRGHKQKFMVPAVRIMAYQYSFFPATIRMWNILPNTLVEAPSVDAFKSHLESMQLSVKP